MNMRIGKIVVAVSCIMMLTCRLFSADTMHTPVRLAINLNSNWLFQSGDVPNGQSDTLCEKAFEQVCLPHSNAIVSHRDIDMELFRKVSWYRRHFTPALPYNGKRVFLEFQGAAQVTEVFVNGTKAFHHVGAYTPFKGDITDLVKWGTDNVIAVRVDSREQKRIPPEGGPIDYMLCGGIARDVTMVLTDPLHQEWIFATLDSLEPTCVNVSCSIRNDGTAGTDCSVTTEIVDTTGNVVANGVAEGIVEPGSARVFTYTTGKIRSLNVWDTERPYLYTVRTTVRQGSKIVDECIEKTGFRSIAFSKENGRFTINGKPLRLRGLNRHETFPFIGRAAANRLQAKDADIVKYELGCNIVRCSHYPQDPEFLQRCDEIGLLVLEEIPGWNYVGDSAWQEIALSNVEEMVVRDRNHPSVISYGVRINQTHDFNLLYEKTNRLSRTLDPTRPTHGVRLKGRFSLDNFMEDIWTQNFVIPQGKPEILPWLITEGVGVGCQVHSWDRDEVLVKIMLRFAEYSDSVAANPFIAGELGWCAFDYNSPHGTADRSICYYGAADIFRISKHAGMYLKSQANPQVAGDVVYIAHTWQKDHSPNDVWVASNSEQVELFVNGVSLGKQRPNQYPSILYPLTVWNDVPFMPGEIKAVGYRGDKVVATHIRRTPGKAVALTFIPDDTVLIAGGDMTRVVVRAIDRYGQTVPQGKNVVELTVSGAADFTGQSVIALEDGKTAFFVKTRATTTGSVMCRAKSRGLKTARTHLWVVVDPQASLRRKVLGQ